MTTGEGLGEVNQSIAVKINFARRSGHRVIESTQVTHIELLFMSQDEATMLSAGMMMESGFPMVFALVSLLCEAMEEKK